MLLAARVPWSTSLDETDPPAVNVVIVQPGLFPWLGAFRKAAATDIWIHLDHVSFQKEGFTHRLRVRDAKGAVRWLTIPVGRQPSGTPIRMVREPKSTSWRNEMARRFDAYFHLAPFADEARQLLMDCIAAEAATPCEMAIASTEATARALMRAPPDFVRSSSLAPTATRSDLIVELTRAIKGKRYIYGPGRKGFADHYLNLETLREAQITPVPFRHHPDIEPCSAIDAIARHGLSACRDLLAGGADDTCLARTGMGEGETSAEAVSKTQAGDVRSR